MIYTEPSRARRFRDRSRILRKALVIASRQHPAPVSGDLVSKVSWTGMNGQPQKDLTTWSDVSGIRLSTASRRWQHLAVCSCSVCGNPRRWFNAMTRQETLADVDASQQFAEAGLNFHSRFRPFS